MIDLEPFEKGQSNIQALTNGIWGSIYVVLLPQEFQQN